MPTSAANMMEDHTPEGVLAAYLLGSLSYDTVMHLQRRLIYDIGGDRNSAAVILFDHTPGLTIGREGSRLHVRPNPEELTIRGWPVRWVSRGGGVLLHLPGQVACYPMLALDRLHLTPTAYLRQLEGIVLELLADYGIVGRTDADRPGVRVGNRLIAHLGIAIRNWISCFGLTINVDPDLEPFHEIRCDGDLEPMTSIQRETQGRRARVAAVRQRLVELIAQRFRFARVSVFHTHPGVWPQPMRHAASTTAR